MAGDLRSPRKRALEIGTEGGKFHKDLPYDPQAGTPQPDSGGTYADPGANVPKPQSGGAPAPQPFGNLRDG